MKKYKYYILIIISVVAIMFGCVYLDGVEITNYNVDAGSTQTFTMKVRIDPAEDVKGTRLIIAVLAPKSWKIAENAKVTYVSTLYKDQTRKMSPIPLDVKPKNMPTFTWPSALRNRFGFGPNILEDMEWVAFHSDDIYNISNGEKCTADVKITTKVGPENMIVKLGFFLNHSDDGLSGDDKRWKISYSDKYYVGNGEGPVIDFCDYHLNLVVPSFATKNDIVTFKYQGSVMANELDGVDEIYLHATAETSGGRTYTVAEKSDKTQMKKESAFGRTFSKTFWVADYFNIPDGEEITNVKYYFTNVDETKIVKEPVKDPETEDITGYIPFEYLFICK